MSQEYLMKKYEIVQKIEKNDPEILGELAEIILATRQKVNYKTIDFTDKNFEKLNKELRERLKK